MATLSDTDIGAIVYSLIPNITTSVSGVLTTIVDTQIYFAENITGENISIAAVTKAFQPGIISLTIASVMKSMEGQGVGTKSVKIGELAITKGMSEGTSTEWKDWGLEQLKSVGERVSFYQTWD